MDEVFVKINGQFHYLWRAIDHDGEVLECFVTKSRDKRSAMKFLKKVMKKHGSPKKVVTDKLASYLAALKELGANVFKKQGAIRTIIVKTLIFHLDEKKSRCRGLRVVSPYKYSPAFILRYITTLTSNATYRNGKITNNSEASHLPNGKGFVLCRRMVSYSNF